MAQMKGKDVTQALGMISEDDVAAGPVLTDEQARLFSELAQISDPEEKATKTSAKLESLAVDLEEIERQDQ